MLLAGLAFFRTRRHLAIENLALRHQLGILKRSVKRPRLSHVDRGLWVLFVFVVLAHDRRRILSINVTN